jgi:hypothetical protein
MESLALLVSIILLFVILIGPIALLFSRLGFVIVGCIVGAFAILVGGYWFCMTPFPISLVGGIGIACGIKALNKI